MRQLRVLAENLPPECAWHRAMTGHSWRDAEYLLAGILDRVGEGAAGIIRAQGGKAKAPKPVPRPGGKEKTSVGNRGEASTDDVVTYIDQFRAQKGA